MGVDTFIKVVIAVIIVVALVAVMAGLAGVISGSVGVVSTGSAYVSDTVPGWGVAGHQWRDDEYVEGQEGPDASYGPGKFFSQVMALVYPGRTSGGLVWDYDRQSNGGWLLVVFGAIPGVLIAWLVVKYLSGYLLGSG